MPKVVEVPGVGNVEFPDSMNDDQISAAIQKQSGAPAASRSEPEKPAISKMLKEYWDQVNPVAAGNALVETAKHPIEAVKAYGKQTGALADAAEKAFSAGRYGEAARHALSFFLNGIPGLGEALDQAGNKFQSGDYAGGIADTAALATNLFATEGAKAALGGLKAAAGGLKAAAPGLKASAAKRLKASAAKNYESILLPTKKAVTRAEQTAAGLAEEKPVALTQKQLLDRAAAEKAKAGPAARAAYSGKPAIDVQPIFDELEKLRTKEATVKGPKGDVVTNEPFNQAVDSFKAKLQEMQDTAGNVPAEVLDDWRDKLFRGQVDAGGNLKTINPQSAKSLEKGTANSIRKLLDSHFPDSKALNDTYKLWANTYDFLEDARKAKIASRRGINVGSSQGFGALVQRMMPRPVREVPAGLAGLFDTVAWNTVSGAVKSSIANALSKGQWGRATALLKGPARAGATGIGALNVIAPALTPTPQGVQQ